MTVSIRKAATSEAKPLIGFYSESSGGKTYSALLLAKGFASDMAAVAMVETEAGRGEAWADDPLVGGYSVIPLRGSFGPKVYGEAISAAEQAKVKVLIVDSASHEWEGVGGVLAMAAENQANGKKGPLVWQGPKMEHQREFMLRLMQTPIPLVIVCMRAKYPMYQVSASDLKEWEAAGRPGNQPKVGEWARSWKLEPKQSDDILFEMFVHGWFDTKEHRFHGTKYTRPTLAQVFVDGECITVDTGKRLAAWSAGTSSSVPDAPKPDVISADQHIVIMDALQGIADGEARLKKMAKVERLTMLPRSAYQRALEWCEKAKAA